MQAFALKRLNSVQSLIIPDPGNSADWNRYAYVNYNPVRYNDPTGHIPQIDDGDILDYIQEIINVDIGYNRRRQDTLFSMAHAGGGANGEWTIDDWVKYYEHRDDYMKYELQWYDHPTGWEGFATAVENLASHYSDMEIGQFVRDFGLLFAGIPEDVSWAAALAYVSGGPNMVDLFFCGADNNDGLNSQYFEVVNGKVFPNDNQSHHYAGAFFLGYYGGMTGGLAGNYFRDVHNPGDIALGNAAVVDAVAIRSSYQTQTSSYTYISGANWNPLGPSALAD